MRLNRGIAVALATFGMVGGAAEALAGTISQWTFPSVTPAPDNSPAPTIGTGVATVLGMTNNYTFSSGNTITGSGTFTYTTLYSIGSVASADVLATASDPNGDANAWRVRGPSNNPGQPPGMGNGWALQAPQYTQGVQFSSSTVGYSGVGFHFDWYTTAQAVNRLQEQYTLNGTTWNNINPVLSGPRAEAGCRRRLISAESQAPAVIPHSACDWFPFMIPPLRFQITEAPQGDTTITTQGTGDSPTLRSQEMPCRNLRASSCRSSVSAAWQVSSAGGEAGEGDPTV